MKLSQDKNMPPLRIPDTVASRPDISVVIPVYRNADTLEELYKRLCCILEARGINFEIVFVDDACPIDSLAILRVLAQNDQRVVVLALAHNVGQNRAVMWGLASARGTWIIIMDADLQDPPEAIPKLLGKGQEGFAAVFAGRRGQYESVSRLFTARLFKRLLQALCGVPADAGLFVAMNQTMRERLLAMQGPHPYVVAMIGCTGLPTTSIPIVRAQRPSGDSAYSFWARFKNAWRGIIWIVVWKWRTLIASGSMRNHLSNKKHYEQ